MAKAIKSNDSQDITYYGINVVLDITAVAGGAKVLAPAVGKTIQQVTQGIKALNGSGVWNETSYAQSSGNEPYISAEVKEKILEGKRIEGKNRIIGGHSSNVVNDESDIFAVEVLKENADGTMYVQYYKQFSDGNISTLKKSTLFPKDWSDDKIITSIKIVGDSSAEGIRISNNVTITLHNGIIDGVEIDVIKEGNNITAGYPVGGKPTPGFQPIE